MFKMDFNITPTPTVSVSTTQNRGSTPEEVASRCVSKLINVSQTAPPAIRDQALAYQGDMERVVAYFMREAIRSDRTTVYNALKEAGQTELADSIRRL